MGGGYHTGPALGATPAFDHTQFKDLEPLGTTLRFRQAQKNTRPYATRSRTQSKNRFARTRSRFASCLPLSFSVYPNSFRLSSASTTRSFLDSLFLHALRWRRAASRWSMLARCPRAAMHSASFARMTACDAWKMHAS